MSSIPTVVSLIPTGGTSVLILCKNDRNVRSVLFTKTSNVTVFTVSEHIRQLLHPTMKTPDMNRIGPDLNSQLKHKNQILNIFVHGKPCSTEKQRKGFDVTISRIY